MPADRTIILAPGRAGLNLRDHPSDIQPDELSDGLNWQIETRGALTRRLGFAAWSSQDTPDEIIALGRLRIAGGTSYVVAHCADGSLQASFDGQAWTQLAASSTLSQTDPAAIIQFEDQIFVSDGTNPVLRWDGTTVSTITATSDVQTLTITGTPTGGTFTLSFGGQTTAAIAYNASATDVQSALRLLSTIGASNVVCTGGALPGTPVVITFAGTLASAPQPQITHTDSFTGGSTPVAAVAHTTLGISEFPHGKYLAVWRGHIYVAGISTEPRTVRWSKTFDPTDWSITTNNVILPDAEPITAIYPSPPSSPTADGVDGLLVFKKRSTYRIYDATDNSGANVTGGSYELTDRGAGCWSSRSIAAVGGVLFLIGEAGVYSTTGHSPLRLVSRKIDPLIRNAVATPFVESNTVAAAYKGRYYLAITPQGETTNTRLLELYLDMPASGDGQVPWMAHDIPVSTLVVFPATSDDVLLGGDSREAANGRVRRLFDQSFDVDDQDAQVPITAYAKTGGLDLGVTEAKRLKRVEGRGRGVIYLSASSDFDGTIGEQGILRMPIADETTVSLWGAFNWGEANWAGSLGGNGGSQIARARYTQRANFFTFDIRATGSEAGTSQPYLGLATFAKGGAEIHSLKTTYTPLDTW